MKAPRVGSVAPQRKRTKRNRHLLSSGGTEEFHRLVGENYKRRSLAEIIRSEQCVEKYTEQKRKTNRGRTCFNIFESVQNILYGMVGVQRKTTLAILTAS